VVICTMLISNAKVLGSILLDNNLYLLIISEGPLSEFNHGLGCVESIRSSSMFGLRIQVILVVWLGSIWTQLRQGLPVKQDIHQNLVCIKSLSSTWTVHRIHRVCGE
jgi:hypothetical protein